MNHLEQSTQAGSELQRSAAHLAGRRRSRKIAIWLLAITIVVAMVAWLTFLGWGMMAVWHWIVDHTKSIWMN